MTTSRTRSGPEDLAKEVGLKARELAGLLRRMIVTRTRSALWQITGHRLLDGEVETRDAEVFGGIGIAARPQEGDGAGAVEAIVAFPQGGGPIVIAARQEAARRVVAVDLAADETQLHGAIGEGGTIIRIRANGTVEIRTVGGTAKRLLTVDDAADLIAAINGATITAGDGGAAFKGSLMTALTGWPTGTTVLKGE